MFKDLIDQTFNKLTVLEFSHTNKGGERVWLCQCECSNLTKVKTHNLVRGKTKSCGCIKTGPPRKSLMDQTFNRLTVIEYIGQTKWRTQRYLCRCVCGNEITTNSTALITGNTKSCGCLNREKDRAYKGSNNPNFNPDLTDEDRIPRRCMPGYKEWRDEVKRLAGYKCAICSSGGYLVSHHLNSYHTHKELRIDLNNGVCLCGKCHMQFHSKYGRKHNTKAQFEEFLNDYIAKSREGNEY